MMELELWQFALVCGLALGACVFLFWLLLAWFYKPFEIDEHLDQINRGQDEELDVLEEIRDALKTRKE